MKQITIDQVFLRIFLIVLLVLPPVFSYAGEVRVLIAFSTIGHTVEKVFLTETNSIRHARRGNNVSASTMARRIALAQSEPVDAYGQVTWFDSAGQVLLHDSLRDPRAAHAPLSNDLQQPHYYLRAKGVYLLSGPAAAVRLSLSFPEFFLNGHTVPAQFWDLYLPQH